LLLIRIICCGVGPILNGFIYDGELCMGMWLLFNMLELIGIGDWII